MSTATTDAPFQAALEFCEHAFPPTARQALALLGQGVSVITPDFRIVWANPALEAWAGPLEQIRGRFCYEVYQRRTEICPDCPSARALAEGGRASCLQSGFSVEGRPLWFELTANVVPDESGMPRLVIEIATDITDILHSRERERLLTTLLDATPLLAAASDTEGVITDVSAATAAFFGCGREDLIGQPVSLLLGQRTESEVRQVLDAACAGGWHGEITLPLPGGETRWVELSVTPLSGDDRQPAGLIGIANDITDRKGAEEEARRNYDTQHVINSLLRLSLENIPPEQLVKRALDLILSIPWLSLESRGCIFLVKDDPDVLVMAAQSGLAEALQESCARVPFGRCLCGRAALTRETQFADYLDERHQATYQEIAPHGHYCVPIVSGDTLLGVINVYLRAGHRLDPREEEFLSAVAHALAGVITRWHADADVKRAEQRYRLLAENVTDVIWTADLDLRLTYVSPSVARLQGYGVDEMKRRGLLEMLTPASLEVATKALEEERALERSGQGDPSRVRTLELEERRADGSTIWTEVNASFLRNADGDAVGLLGVSRDITERKRMGTALRESEERYRHLFERLNDAVLIADPATGVLLDVNAAAERLMGYSRDELIGMHQSRLHPPEQVEPYRERFRRHVAATTASDFDAEIVRKDGTVVPVRISAAVAEIGGQRVLQGIFSDITERKRIEEALRRASEEQEILLSSVPAMIWFKDTKNTFIRVNKAAAAGVGLTPEEIAGRSCYELFPELAEQYYQDDLEVIRSGKPSLGIVEQMETASGEKRWVETDKIPHWDERGNIAGVIVFAMDVTERKRAEEALRASEGQYRALVETTDTGYVIIDQEGRVLDANPEYVRLSGHRELAEIRGGAVIEWTAEYEKEKNAQAVRQCLQDGQVRNLVIDYVDLHGNVTPIEISATVVEAGGTPRILALCRDITERKRMEDALRRSEALNRGLVEHLPQRVFLKDRDSVYVSCNANYARDLGIEPARIVGKDDFAFYPRELAEAYRADDRAVVASEALKDIEERYLTSGEELWIHTIKVPYRDDQGQVVGVLGIFEDITERKRMEDALAQRQRSLQAGNLRLAAMTKEMEQFLYLASHDLRAPLVTIEGFASRLLARHAEDCGPEAIHALERIRAAVGSMAALIESLLRLSRAHTRELRPGALEMNEIAAQVVCDLEQQATDAQVGIEVAPDLPPAWGDRDALYQILLNLVSNAIKYHGESEPRVWISGQEEEEGTRVAVRDNGIGVPTEKIGEIFLMFSRADISGRPGLGIGLAGAKRLVERHGGRIWAESVLGQGSVFHFILPRKEASDG